MRNKIEERQIQNIIEKMQSIYEKIEKSNDELRQEGADALTEELIAMGII